MSNLYKVVGRRYTEFDTRDGNHIKGYSVFLQYSDPNIEGVGTDRVFVSDEKFRASPFKVGANVDLVYNKYGKVQAIIPSA